MNNDISKNLERCLMQHITNAVYKDRDNTPTDDDYRAAIREIEEFLNNNVAVENVIKSIRKFYDL